MRPAFPLCAALIVLSLAAAAPAQEGATITVDVDVVNVLATVRDKKGRLVTDLDKDDFILKEEGEPREIRYFARQTDLPLTVGLLVDTSVSQQRVLGIEKSASAQFFREVLRHQEDLAFLISFDINVELLQDLTGSQRLLQHGLEALEIQGNARGLTPGPVPTDKSPTGTALFDAVYLASREILRHQVGRKAIVIVSDGNDYGSRVEKEEAIEAAHRADVVIYGIRYFDRQFYVRSGGFGTGGAGTLKDLAQETGGGMFKVSKKEPLTGIFEQIQAELRSQYNIGFAPGEGPPGFRKVELSTRDGKFEVQARSGYYRGSEGGR